MDRPPKAPQKPRSPWTPRERFHAEAHQCPYCLSERLSANGGSRLVGNRREKRVTCGECGRQFVLVLTLLRNLSETRKTESVLPAEDLDN